MAIWNLGSINADMVYAVPRLPVAGETIAATGLARYLGGKGANMSVAAARAAAHVRHIGAVGSDGRWAVERLLEYGVDTRHIDTVDAPTGHAIVAVDARGENQIIIQPGANRAIPGDLIARALTEASPGDILLTQNETNGQAEAAALARRMGLSVVHAAAPFDVDAVRALLPLTDLLILNAVEAGQLRAASGQGPADLGLRDVIVTRGADGATWWHDGAATDFAARKVTPVDTTGAGDTFTGYVVAGLDRGLPMAQAIAQAMVAASIMVTRPGTADVIPDLRDVQAVMGT